MGIRRESFVPTCLLLTIDKWGLSLTKGIANYVDTARNKINAGIRPEPDVTLCIKLPSRSRSSSPFFRAKGAGFIMEADPIGIDPWGKRIIIWKREKNFEKRIIKAYDNGNCYSLSSAIPGTGLGLVCVCVITGRRPKRKCCSLSSSVNPHEAEREKKTQKTRDLDAIIGRVPAPYISQGNEKFSFY